MSPCSLKHHIFVGCIMAHRGHGNKLRQLTRHMIVHRRVRNEDIWTIVMLRPAGLPKHHDDADFGIYTEFGDMPGN